jgi:ribosomal protein S27AE
MGPVMTNSIIRERMDQWTNPRLYYLTQIIRYTPSYCPECGTTLIHDEEEIYCPSCGLVTSGSIEYVAGFKIRFPYGRRG